MDVRRADLAAKLTATENSYRAASRQIGKLEKELFAAELRRDEADKRADKLLTVIADLHKQLGRQPEVVVESILTGITPLFLGYKEDAAKNSEVRTPEAVYETPDVKGYFPDVEFDPFLESESQWPDPTSMTPMASSAPRTNNGLESKRPRGETPFTSGSGTAHPPGNAVE